MSQPKSEVGQNHSLKLSEWPRKIEALRSLNHSHRQSCVDVAVTYIRIESRSDTYLLLVDIVVHTELVSSIASTSKPQRPRGSARWTGLTVPKCQSRTFYAMDGTYQARRHAEGEVLGPCLSLAA